MTDNNLNLSEVVVAAQGGDRAAFGLLYDRFARPLYGFILARVGHHPTTEDLVSTVWVKALHSIKRCHPDQAQAWFYTIAHHTLTDYYRGRRPEINWDQLPDLSDDTNPGAETDRRRAYEAIRQHLDRLSPEQREIIILRLWDDLTYEQIAAVLKKSPNSCRMQMARGVKTLREHLPEFITLILVYAIH